MFKQFYSLFGCNGQLPNFTVRAKFCDVSRFPNHSTCVIPVHRILQVPTRGWNKAVKSKKWILKSPGCTEHTGRRNVDGWIFCLPWIFVDFQSLCQQQEAWSVSPVLVLVSMLEKNWLMSANLLRYVFLPSQCYCKKYSKSLALEMQCIDTVYEAVT